MPSEAAKKRQAKKKAAAQSRGKPKPAVQATENGVESSNGTENGAGVKLDLSNRSCTGVLASHEQSRDVKIENFSITFHGVELLTDTKLELNCGRRYGLLGLNGCGRFFMFLWKYIYIGSFSFTKFKVLFLNRITHFKEIPIDLNNSFRCGEIKHKEQTHI